MQPAVPPSNGAGPDRLRARQSQFRGSGLQPLGAHRGAEGAERVIGHRWSPVVPGGPRWCRGRSPRMDLDLSGWLEAAVASDQ